MSDKKVGQAIAFRGIDSALQKIDSEILQIKYFPDLWYFIGHIVAIEEKQKKGEISIDEMMSIEKNLVHQYFTEVEE